MLINHELEAWQAWQRRQKGVVGALRSLRNRKQKTPTLRLSSWGDPKNGSVLLALDGLEPSLRAALVDPVRKLHESGRHVCVLSSLPVEGLFPGEGHSRVLNLRSEISAQLPTNPCAVVSVGNYLPAGAAAYAVSQRLHVPYFVVQHGVLTPFAPPLPRNTTLLAWSEEDLRFWAGDARGINGQPVGSQLLWNANVDSAAHSTQRDGSSENAVTFLGQLHGAELPRSTTRMSVASLRSEHTVRYRPHPVESDIQSRLQHRIWAHQGVEIVESSELSSLPGPVLAHFSTGILESSAAGIASYAYCSAPPRWLEELWDRYCMQQWGSSQATKAAVPTHEPAAAIAERISTLSG